VLAVGCPAEERGGGKIPLITEGVFDDVDLAIMIHTVPDGIRLDPRGTSSQAIGQFLATYTGKAAHAAAAPHLGRNTTRRGDRRRGRAGAPPAAGSQRPPPERQRRALGRRTERHP